jgi:hypothetical protein
MADFEIDHIRLTAEEQELTGLLEELSWVEAMDGHNEVRVKTGNTHEFLCELTASEDKCRSTSVAATQYFAGKVCNLDRFADVLEEKMVDRFCSQIEALGHLAVPSPDK